MGLVAWLYIASWSCLVTLAMARHSVWIGYSLPPYSAASPQGLGQLALEESDNGTVEGFLASWTPPPSSYNSIRIGLLSDEPGSSGFSGSIIQVADNLLLASGIAIEVSYDQARKQAWGLRLSVDGLETMPRSAGTSPELKISSRARPPSPFVNKPVIVSAEGRVQDQPQEKTLLQK